jgi:hypothetical protein
MTDESIAGNLEGGQASSRSLPLVTIDPDLVYVGDEIRFPNVRASQRITILAHLKIIVLVIVPVFELVGTIENEIEVVEDIYDHWGIGDRRNQDPLAPAID